MAIKKKMATAKKRTKKTGKIVEFFSAIFGFWPVWLSAVFIVAVIFGYDYYNRIETTTTIEETIVSRDENTIVPAKIKVTGRLHYIDEKLIKKLVAETLQQGYLGSDLIKIRETIEAEAWVKRAIVKRLPPDILQVDVIEQKPMLRWRDEGLISQQGELFFPQELEQFSRLAAIDSEKKSIQMALDFLKQSMPVLQTMQLKLKSVREDELGAWQINTVEGIELKFGRSDFQHRLQLLKKLWPSALQKGAVQKVDLRYANGAAVTYLQANG